MIRRHEPVFSVRSLDRPAEAYEVLGTDGLLEAVPTLRAGVYAIMLDGELWGSADVAENGTWVIESDGFSAGPGFVVI
jgi:hypothetical protein